MGLSNVSEGLRAMILGMGVVFASLFALYLILLQFQRVFGGTVGKPDTEETIRTAPAFDTEKAELDDNELIAAITAAITQYAGKDSDKIAIKNITEV